MSTSESKNRRIRVGLAGLGGHGGTMQLACERASNIDVVAVFDPDEEEAEKAAKRFDCYQAISYEEMIRRDELDAVMLITPNYLHRKQVVAALEAGRHVFVEKPMAINLDEGMEMISKAEAKGSILMVGHNMRFWKTAQHAKEIITAGGLGQIISVEIHFSAPTGMHLPVDSWRRKVDLCPLVPVTQLAIHAFDLVHFLLGYIEEVTTYTRSALTQDEVIDSASAILRIEGGALGTMISNYCTPERFELRVSGTRGAFVLTPSLCKFTAIDPTTGKVTEETDVTDENNGFESYDKIVEAFGTAVLDQSLPETDGWVGLQALAVVEAMQRSAAASATPWVVERFQSASLESVGADAAISSELI